MGLLGLLDEIKEMATPGDVEQITSMPQAILVPAKA